jgi:phosphohistidine phosphatase SixA
MEQPKSSALVSRTVTQQTRWAAWLCAVVLLPSLGCRSSPRDPESPRLLKSSSAYTPTLQSAPSGSSSEPAQPRAAWPPILIALVRHAEKATGDDPGLTEAGLARAQELARLLGGASVTHLYASTAQRARLTAAPLGQRFDLPIETYQANQLEAHAATLRALPAGSVALSVGHSNTVPALAALLGAPLEGLSVDPRFGPLLPEAEHDRLLLLLLPGNGEGAAKSLELRFGR